MGTAMRNRLRMFAVVLTIVLAWVLIMAGLVRLLVGL
jgi:hypothetical protein